jgi:hypothetical protein
MHLTRLDKSPSSVPSPRNTDKCLDSRLLLFERRPSWTYKTGNGVALEYRANFCTRDIRSRSGQCSFRLSVVGVEIPHGTGGKGKHALTQTK